MDEFDISDSDVEKIHNGYWKMIYDNLRNMDIFNIPENERISYRIPYICSIELNNYKVNKYKEKHGNKDKVEEPDTNA